MESRKEMWNFVSLYQNNNVASEKKELFGNLRKLRVKGGGRWGRMGGVWTQPCTHRQSYYRVWWQLQVPRNPFHQHRILIPSQWLVGQESTHLHIYFLRCLTRFNMSTKIVSSFYRCAEGWSLRACISDWYGNDFALGCLSLQRVVNTSLTITVLPSVEVSSRMTFTLAIPLSHFYLLEDTGAWKPRSPALRTTSPSSSLTLPPSPDSWTVYLFQSPFLEGAATLSYQSSFVYLSAS